MGSQLEKLFDQYAQSHQNIWNRRCHAVGMPLIIGSIIALLMDPHSTAAWSVFALGWGFQILGHWIEGTTPEFLKNPIFLLVGPLYFVKKILKK